MLGPHQVSPPHPGTQLPVWNELPEESPTAQAQLPVLLPRQPQSGRHSKDTNQLKLGEAIKNSGIQAAPRPRQQLSLPGLSPARCHHAEGSGSHATQPQGPGQSCQRAWLESG